MKTGTDTLDHPLKDWRQEMRWRYYESKPGWKDHSQLWRSFITPRFREKSSVLEIGGGPALDLSKRLRPFAEKLVGVDVDPVIRDNPLLDRAVVYDGNVFSGLADGEFDLAIADWVNEHVPNPAQHFREVARVLKPGGLYMFRTVNLCHYKALVASVTPHRLQVPLVRWLRHSSPDHYDAYKTYYRANTRRKIYRLGEQAGMKPLRYETIESAPGYGNSVKALFLAFMWYERLVNRYESLSPFRHAIHCVLQKQE